VTLAMMASPLASFCHLLIAPSPVEQLGPEMEILRPVNAQTGERGLRPATRRSNRVARQVFQQQRTDLLRYLVGGIVADIGQSGELV
jgi:hypothetical protein